MTSAPLTAEALVEARRIADEAANHPMRAASEYAHRTCEASLQAATGSTSPGSQAEIDALRLLLTAAEASLQRVTAERDDLKIAAGFKPGDFRDDRSREVILNDIAGMRPAMVEARQAAARVQGDADLWTMRMLEEWPGDTLLLRLWRQRKEATKAARTAEAALATATAEAARLRGEVEAKERARWLPIVTAPTDRPVVVRMKTDRLPGGWFVATATLPDPDDESRAGSCSTIWHYNGEILQGGFRGTWTEWLDDSGSDRTALARAATEENTELQTQLNVLTQEVLGGSNE